VSQGAGGRAGSGQWEGEGRHMENEPKQIAFPAFPLLSARRSRCCCWS